MTTEQKAKAYDEAFERAREALNDGTISSNTIAYLQDIFPELKDSEDGENKRISKEITQFLKQNNGWNREWLDWLEKQGEKKTIDNLTPQEAMDIAVAKCFEQGEKPKWTEEDERIRKWLIGYFHQYKEDGIEKYANGLKVESIIAWLEKQGKQEEPQVYETKDGEMITYSENKGYKVIEPKFHEGDWVVWDNKVSCHVDNIYQGKDSLMYTITDTNNMTRSYSVKSFDNNAHHWTIADAKDGDVLLFEGYYNSIVLFQGIGINGKGRINYHCKCDLGDYSFGIQGDVACLGTIEKDAERYHPATKEQCELLFAKMKKAGYEWDAEKKEVREIEKDVNKSKASTETTTNTIEDERPETNM